MSSNGYSAPFTLLADPKPRWKCFGAGFSLEFLAVFLVVVVPILIPQKLEMLHRYNTTPIAAPPVTPWKPQPVAAQKKFAVRPKPVEVAKKIEPEIVTPPKPKLIAPVFSSPVAHPATARRNTPAPDVPEMAPAKPLIQSASMGSSAIPTIRKPREAVQTGGFGDPNGVPATGTPSKAANIAQLGSYDLPPGPGYGNGTGGAKGARGIVASPGFGNGVAIGGNGGGGGGNRGSVRQGVFPADQPVAEQPKVKTASNLLGKTEPVEILFKPKPVYTDLAREKRIEGEVLIEVVFSATGQVEVQHVVRGLGYGLDEAAVAAAHQIRFRPARQGGQPVDSTATVHILFEMAY